jgi:hypothetical protein
LFGDDLLDACFDVAHFSPPRGLVQNSLRF